MNKQEILAAARDGYTEWLAVVKRVPEDKMTEPGAAGHWTVKDVIAHIASGHRWLAAQLEAAAHRQLPTAAECFGQDDPPPPDVSIADNQDRNDWNYQRYRDWSLDAVLQEARFTYDWLLQQIEALPDPAFDAIYTIAEYDNINHVRPAAEDDEFRFPLWRLLYNGTAEHYPAHIRDLNDWLDRESDR
ncbi:MAG: maleylpyruvate isomerase N-terminal domain-containing protein [Thermomicrobiales bacterium]